MGNGVGKLGLCFAGDAGEISLRRHDVTVYLSDPPDEGLGHSFCYIKHDPFSLSSSKVHCDDDNKTTPFKSISGASISANPSTPLSTAPINLSPYNNGAHKASSFESSDSFASIPLQPIPRNSNSNSIHSAPITRHSAPISGPVERGFLSGPIERSFISGPLEHQFDQFQRYKPKSKKRVLLRILKRAIELDWVNGSDKKNDNFTVSGTISNNMSTQLSLVDDEEEESIGSEDLQWAQGKAGEDRVHVVVSEDHGWVFVGIYDGFNGPDATDFLANNLYNNVYNELNGLLCNDKFNSEVGSNQDHEIDQTQMRNQSLDFDSKDSGSGSGEILKAISEGLRKTEESFLEITDLMMNESPELSLMGSCVLVMVMKGEDLFLMNVGDSRAVLGQKPEPDKELNRINEETLNDLEEFDGLPKLTSLQLTMDHSTSVEEEVLRIKNEHWDDPSAIANDRVKGFLKVTRAFGTGFLKQPKWNNAVLEMFRIDYVGSSPYISCVPSLYHHRLSSRDRFLILSSDGLYQYFTNDEAVSQVVMFMDSFPEGDPAQHLVEEVLFRAAKKAGMDFHELLDIPQGNDRRRYHDDVSIIIISFEGRIWRSSV